MGGASPLLDPREGTPPTCQPTPTCPYIDPPPSRAAVKVPPSTRQAILDTLCLLGESGGATVKAFLPQLQSTYVKVCHLWLTL